MTDVNSKLGMSLDEIVKRQAKPKPAPKPAPNKRQAGPEPAELNMSLDDVLKSRARGQQGPPGRLTSDAGGHHPGGRGPGGRGGAARGRGGRFSTGQRVVEPVGDSYKQQKEAGSLRIQTSFTDTKPAGQRQVVAKRHPIVFPNSSNASQPAAQPAKPGRPAPKRSVHERVGYQPQPQGQYHYQKQYQEPPLEFARNGYGRDPYADEEQYHDQDQYYPDEYHAAAYPPAKHARHTGGPAARHQHPYADAYEDQDALPAPRSGSDSRAYHATRNPTQQPASHRSSSHHADRPPSHRAAASANPAPRQPPASSKPSSSKHAARSSANPARRDPSPSARSSRPRSSSAHHDHAPRTTKPAPSSRPSRHDPYPSDDAAAPSALDSLELLLHPTTRDLTVKLRGTIVAFIPAANGQCTVLPYGGPRTKDVFECLQAVLLSLGCALTPASDHISAGNWRIIGPGFQVPVTNACVLPRTNGARAAAVYKYLGDQQLGGAGAGDLGAPVDAVDSRSAAHQAATLASSMAARQQGILPSAVLAMPQQQLLQQQFQLQQQQLQQLQQQQQQLQQQQQQQQHVLLQQQPQQQQQQQPHLLFAQVQQPQQAQQQQPQQQQQHVAAGGFVPMQMPLPSGVVPVDSMGMGQHRDTANGRAASQRYASY